MKIRPNLISVAGLVLALAFGCSGGDRTADTPARSGPAIEFETTEFDFGTITQQEKVDHVFPFRSVGTEPVRIKRVKAVCACTIPRYTREPVPPGESGQVEVIFESRNLFDKVEKKLAIYTDDPENSLIHLRVVGKVRREFWVTPERVLLGPLRSGEDAGKHEFWIHWLPEVELQVTAIEASHDSIQILEKEPFETEGSRGLHVVVTVKGWEQVLEESHTSQYQHMIEVRTDHPKYPRTLIPVTGTRFVPLRWEPKMLAFGVIHAGEEIHKTIRLMTPRGVDLEIGEMEAPDFVELEVMPPDVSGGEGATERAGLTTTEVRMTLLGNAPPGSFKEHIKLHTNLPEVPVVSVYIYGKVE